MSIAEDRLRAALAETAREVAPGTVPPLRLPEPGPRRLTVRGLRRRPVRPPGRSRRAVAALGAAAAVIAIVTGAVLAARSRPAAVSPAGPLHGIPPYFAELTAASPQAASNGLDRMVSVRNARTGTQVARIAAPAPDNDFIAVTAAADGRTFALAAVHADGNGQLSAARLYLLRVGQAGSQPVLTRLRAAPLGNSQSLTGLKLSPDGTKLAVAIVPGLLAPSEGRSRGHAELRVYSVPGGTVQVWNTVLRRHPAPIESPLLSWTADGTQVAYNWNTGTSATSGLRLLDLRGTGCNLISDSRLISRQSELPPGFAGRRFEAAALTADGRTAIADVVTFTAHKKTYALEKVQVPSGRTSQIRGLTGGWKPVQVEWTNATGSAVGLELGKTVKRGGGTVARERLGVLRGDRLTVLPGPVNQDTNGLGSDYTDDIAW